MKVTADMKVREVSELGDHLLSAFARIYADGSYGRRDLLYGIF